jgi:cell division protease FtsH
MIDYSLFRQFVQEGRVAEVTNSGEEIRGRLKEPAEIEVENQDESITYTEFITYLSAFGDDELLALLEANDVAIETEPTSEFSIWALALNFLPILLMLGLVFFYLRRAQQQGQGIFSMRRSQAKLFDRAKEVTTFEDIAGLEGAKVELEEIIDYLKSPAKVASLGGTAPKGVLLVGPPGTGKTLLARAMAGEADVPFFSITGSDFMEMFVGVGASRVREMFSTAWSVAPCIIFIDELDSIGRRRGADLENILNEAALLAARKEKEKIESEDIEEARDKIMMGGRDALELSLVFDHRRCCHRFGIGDYHRGDKFCHHFDRYYQYYVVPDRF